MKRFSFGLQKLLDLREFTEKQAKEELGKVISVANSINLELKDIASERVHSQKSRDDIFDINAFRAIEFYVNRLDLRKEELFEELATTELLIEQKRAIFTEAMKNRKVITKLREKQQKTWHKEMLKEEEEAIDDVVNARSSRIDF